MTGTNRDPEFIHDVTIETKRIDSHYDSLTEALLYETVEVSVEKRYDVPTDPVDSQGRLLTFNTESSYLEKEIRWRDRIVPALIRTGGYFATNAAVFGTSIEAIRSESWLWGGGAITETVVGILGVEAAVRASRSRSNRLMDPDHEPPRPIIELLRSRLEAVNFYKEHLLRKQRRENQSGLPTGEVPVIDSITPINEDVTD